MESAVPECGAVLLGLGDPDLGGAFAQHPLDDRLVMGDFDSAAVDVDEHNGVGVRGVSGVVELLQAGDPVAVEPFHRGGHDAGRDDRGDGVGRLPSGREGAHQAVGDLGDRA